MCAVAERKKGREKVSKVLSVSIASYNVENFLARTLDSCLVSEIMDKLEVIIVNDGSKDKTAELAQTYVERWPETFRLINKENGGYGSTVNAGIRAATGTYFRLLDGDDWFDQQGLVRFIADLENAKEDMIVAKFQRVFEEDGHIEVRDEAQNVPFQVGTFDQLPEKAWFTMHAVTYRTKILQEHDITLTEHCFYTDQEYDLLPLRWVETIRIVPEIVYCYRIGRSEQSVSLAGVEKHYNEQSIVIKRLLREFGGMGQQSAKDRYIFSYLVKRIRFQIRYYLIISKSKEHKRELIEFTTFLKENYPAYFQGVLSQSRMVKGLVWSRYLAYGVLHRIMLSKYRY